KFIHTSSLLSQEPHVDLDYVAFVPLLRVVEKAHQHGSRSQASHRYFITASIILDPASASQPTDVRKMEKIDKPALIFLFIRAINTSYPPAKAGWPAYK